MQLKREQFDQTNPFARQEGLARLARRATAADLRRMLDAAPLPDIDIVVSTPEEDGAGIRFTEVPPIPIGSERPPQTLPSVLSRTRRAPRLDRLQRMRWAITETREYLHYAVQLQRGRIARWLGRRR